MRLLSHLNACKIVRDGAAPELPAGAFNFSNTTRTILQRNSKFNNIEIQTGATSTFVYALSSIQHLFYQAIILRRTKRRGKIK